MKTRQKIEAGCVGVAGAVFLFAACTQNISLGQPYYEIYVDGEKVGSLPRSTDVEKLIIEAKRQAMQETDGYAYITSQVTYGIQKKAFEPMGKFEEVEWEVKEKLKENKINGKVSAYTVTTEGYSANFASRKEAERFLEQVKNHTDGGSGFHTILRQPAGYEGAYLAQIQGGSGENAVDTLFAGISGELMRAEKYQEDEKNYQEKTGILTMDFADTVYGYENVVGLDELSDVSLQVGEVTKEKETNTIYVVEAGDCLSIIAEKFDTSVDSIMSLNELSGEDAPVYTDQELIVAVPRPDISLKVSQGVVYEESYEAEEQVIKNDGWYTNHREVHQEGTAGLRRVNDIVTSENGIEIARETVHTQILTEAIPTIVEEGTIVPPSYIKPLGGGRYTSGFGRRWGRMHKGVDWATPIGTNVYASSGGTVSIAGAVRGYGYAVYINHPDGRQTRYGHLSKVLVSPGQYVEQGQSIALSGNTGRSTGPHVHFEILINGSQVNPLDYIR
ncbi:MAG: peptidoglycan DD-metalloendopeptidase family protein [Roseburia sp.]|nr:peptidoglycan DD-metalloendopeptidase family protein [Roseburia sp.]